MILYAILIGLAAGLSSGAFGIGGGVLIVPALVGLLGFSQLRAQGTSLVALLAPVGVFALLEYWRNDQVDLKAGLFIALGFFIGGYGGSHIAIGLGEAAVRKGFAVFLAALAVWMFTRP